MHAPFVSKKPEDRVPISIGRAALRRDEMVGILGRVSALRMIVTDIGKKWSPSRARALSCHHAN